MVSSLGHDSVVIKETRAVKTRDLVRPALNDTQNLSTANFACQSLISHDLGLFKVRAVLESNSRKN